MQSTTPPQSHGNHYKHGHHQLFVQSPEQNKMNVESAAERGRRPDIQCTAATPNRNDILRYILISILKTRMPYYDLAVEMTL